VAERIAAKQKEYRDRFDELTKRDIAFDPKRLSSLENLVKLQVAPSASLEAELRAIPSSASLEKTRILWTTLRQAEPEEYGFLLYKEKIISRWRHWWWLKKGRARTVSRAAILATLMLLAAAGAEVFAPVPVPIGTPQRIQFRYHQWRATKQNASKWDQYRTERYFHEVIEDPKNKDNLEQIIRALAVPVAPPALLSRYQLATNGLHFKHANRHAFSGF